MISLNEAVLIAQKYLSENVVLDEKPILQGEYGWIFGYQSAAYLSSGKFEDMLVGNAPLLVEKSTGNLICLGTAYPTEFYVENYLLTGDPHRGAGPSLTLDGWREGVQKVEATKVIKVGANMGLKEAKSVVDQCLDGSRPNVRCEDVASADVLATRLNELGFDVSRNAE
ncbi:YrhB domain-containing protein [Anderseniella sp. Alg231-50]|uniref:YrhB domain-containing protein n=1 Tax=Anderseniella sp. Alg231-50 TaxID=1922226 RepID=UPI00307C6A67